ncbi:MAG: RdgB/HAM1 family non-canonical purine NTP pyrophosphatase [Lachnospiraceae bacterium]|nr:RdgB/HAM1 family non-canonical purine NTP pyrophosphatase [Lachnospiraceae bacterium]
MKILFATKNEGKLREIREILGPDYEVLSLLDLAEVPEIVEDGTSFEENALIKVRAIGPQKDTVVLADDSGLCIDAFSGGPGVYSSRFLGEDTDYIFKNNYILEKLSGLPDEQRGAHYSCVIAALFPDGTEAVTEARMEGIISEKPMGSGGFGYDPILYLPEFGKTAAEITAEEKNRISHRGLALEKMKEILQKR